ncbi:hypothetical protein CMV_026821, partial [Castanea mollissima]
ELTTFPWLNAVVPGTERNTGIWDEVSVSITGVSCIPELPSMTIAFLLQD